MSTSPGPGSGTARSSIAIFPAASRTAERIVSLPFVAGQLGHCRLGATIMQCTQCRDIDVEESGLVDQIAEYGSVAEECGGVVALAAGQRCQLVAEPVDDLDRLAVL